MPISIIDNFTVNTTKNIDSRLGPYSSIAEVTGSISSLLRYVGMTVTITGSGSPVEYWFNPTTANTDLVLKTSTTASYALAALSASYATTASYALNVPTVASTFPFTGSAIISGSLTVTGSVNLGLPTGTSFLLTNADTLVITGSLFVTGSSVITGSLKVSAGITGSLFGTATTASFVTGSIFTGVNRAASSSYAIFAVSASYIDGGFY